MAKKPIVPTLVVIQMAFVMKLKITIIIPDFVPRALELIIFFISQIQLLITD
jgi:hypothetical protein